MSQTLRHVVLLLVVSTAVQAWSAWHAVTAAPDAVRYVALADEMEESGWLATIRAESEHPLFPTSVWLTRKLVRAVRGEFAELDATSVSLASVVPLILAIVPIYFILLVLTAPRPAFMGGLFFGTLHRVAMLGPDGLSDSTHLLLAAISIWTIVAFLARLTAKRQTRAVKNRTPEVLGSCPAAGLSLIIGGASLGLALTARAEALLVVPALLASVAWMQLRPATRCVGPDCCVGLFSLGAGLVCSLGMYFVLIDATSPGTAWQRILGRGDGLTASNIARNLNETVAATYTQPLPDGAKMSFERKESSSSSRFKGIGPAVRQYFVELACMLQPMVGGLALAGAWLITRQVAHPARRFALCLFAVVSLGAIVHASQAGYLQGRHLLLGMVVTLAPAGLATEVLGARLALALRRAWRPASDGLLRTPIAVSTWAMAILALATILPLTLRPLHASRSSHRAAANWLSQHANGNSLVLDSHGLTGLYSGLPTKSYQSARRAFAHPHLAFVVVEQRELVSDSARANTLRHLLTTSATEAARFDGPKADSSHDVIVYRWQPARFAELVLPRTRIAGGDAMLNPLRR